MAPHEEVVSNFFICPLQTNSTRCPTAIMRINEFKLVQFYSLLLSTSALQKRKRRGSNHLLPDLLHDELDHRATVPCQLPHIMFCLAWICCVVNLQNQMYFDTCKIGYANQFKKKLLFLSACQNQAHCNF